MRYLAVVCDYDGTLASEGIVGADGIAALERLRASGRRSILVTGRQLPDLLVAFPRADLFDRIVAENGAVLYRPPGREERLLGDPPPSALIERLRSDGVDPLSIGRVIVATLHPQEHVVLDAIRDLGLELKIVFNQGAVMVLPSGIGKASGLRTALRELSMSPHETVGIGNAENDHELIMMCECAVAVADAVPSLRSRADLVTRGPEGAGVVELIEQLVSQDLASVEVTRHNVPIGRSAEGREVRLPARGRNVLVAGPSGSGKTTMAMAIVERLVERGYQFCIIDPEGDYAQFEDCIQLGDIQRPPDVEEVLQVLANPAANVSANLLGIALDERPAFLEQIFPWLQSMRARTGRPHWILIDEAHHLWPRDERPSERTLPRHPGELLLVTVHPDEVASAILAWIDVVIAVGPDPEAVIASFCAAVSEPPPPVPRPERTDGAIVWDRTSGAPPQAVLPMRGRAEHLRHFRKYADGDLGDNRSFYFRGPDGRLNLRARNITTFLELAQGVDDVTWQHHLNRGDYSRWFREEIKDEPLAASAAAVERRDDLSVEETRATIRRAIVARYTRSARS